MEYQGGLIFVFPIEAHSIRLAERFISLGVVQYSSDLDSSQYLKYIQNLLIENGHI